MSYSILEKNSLAFSLLCVALCLLADVDDPAHKNFTVVNQEVTAVNSNPQMAHARGMVNAVLRRFLRERETLMPSAVKTPLGMWNYPVWWTNRMKAAYPQQWQTIITAGNATPPLTLRVNRRKTSIADYLQILLARHDIAARQIGIDAIHLDSALSVAQIPSFKDGLASVQDAGAQLTAPLLAVHDSMQVLNACTASGCKTSHIPEIADVELTALDNNAKRLQHITQNLQRPQLQAQILQGDASTGSAGGGLWDGLPFDNILADVPYAASSIVHRHQDIRWLRRKTDTEQLATLSPKILDNLWQMLRPDGKLLLVTCSV